MRINIYTTIIKIIFAFVAIYTIAYFMQQTDGCVDTQDNHYIEAKEAQRINNASFQAGIMLGRAMTKSDGR